MLYTFDTVIKALVVGLGALVLWVWCAITSEVIRSAAATSISAETAIGMELYGLSDDKYRISAVSLAKEITPRAGNVAGNRVSDEVTG